MTLLPIYLLLSFLLLPVHSYQSTDHTVDEEKVWKYWSVWDLYWWSDCTDDHHDYNNPDAFPVHNITAWNLLRDTYRKTVGRASTIPAANDDNHRHHHHAENPSGFQVDTEIRKTMERGRGNYAIQDIPKDTLVWKSNYTAQFTTARQYRSFLRALPPPLACDVLLWAYTRSTPTGTVVACVDLDPGSFINDANTDTELNLKLGNSLNDFENTGCDLEFYARRDIRKGEELTIDYGFSLGNPGWITMGLMPRSQDESTEDGDDYEDGWSGDADSEL